MDRSRSRRPSEGKWLHYADPALASMCRSATGSNVPVGDTDITSRIQRTCRALQIHSAATSGINRNQAAKNTQARHLAAALYDDHAGFFPSPKGAGYDDDADLFA